MAAVEILLPARHRVSGATVAPRGPGCGWYNGAVERRGAEGREAFVRSIFDGIAGRYDAMNLLMTAGLWRLWQRAFVRHAGIGAGARVLDVGCGTAELTLVLARMVGPGGRVVGVDFSEGMLAVGRAKVARSPLADRIELRHGDALDLPFAAGTFDAAASAFVMRNVADLDRALAEMARVVRPGGRLAILELSHPRGPLRRVLLFYVRRVLPLLGSWAREAYAWLPRSLDGFPDAEVMAARAEASGWRDVRFLRLTSGLVALHTGASAGFPATARR
jgi:demethylmenaquinone methyltransferase/2-methoxy-6-polyprenyl-1,4-benzoquinol methylase